MSTKFFSSLIFLTALLVFDGWGQVNISAGGTYTENFTIGTTATATLPTSWKMDKNATVRLVGTYASAVTATEQIAGNSMSSSAANGLYNFGAGVANSSTERAIGGISSGSASKSVNSYLWLKNNGLSTIDNFTISYKVEKYRNGTNTAGFSMQLYYSTDGANWTVAGSDFLTSFAGADADNNGYATAPGTTVSISNKTLNVSVSAGSNLYLAWNYSVTTGTTTTNAQALGIDDVSITATASGLLSPPTLTADATNNTVDNNIDITFTDDATWRTAVTAVKIGTTALTVTTDYVLSSGNLQLKPSGLNALLTASGSKTVSIEATGYNNASVTQVINAGAPTTNSTATISAALALGTTRTVTATAKDQYSNLVSGYTFKYDATVTNNNVTTGESYTIDGTARTTTQNDLSVVATTNASGVATFTIQVPAQVDQNDGLSVQVQLTNGLTNIGTAFSIVGPDPIVVVTGVDPTTNSFAVGSSNNVLYRLKLDITVNPATLNGAAFLIDGAFAASDISAGGYKLYYSADAIFDPGTDALLESINASNDNTELLGFTATKLFNVGSGYLFLTVDLDASASIGNLMSITTPVISNFSFTTTVSPSGTFAAAEIHPFAGVPPTLISDGSNNNVDNDIDITFIDDVTWRNAITAVKINGTSLAVADYAVTAGNLKLKPSNGNSLLTSSGTKTVSVVATNYGAASVSQVINPGAPTALSTAAIDVALALNTTRTITATAKDQYSNLVSGYTFKYDVTVTNIDGSTGETYTIDGVGRTASISDLSFIATTNAGGIATITVTIPTTVDENDGISVQVQLADGTTNVGTAFNYTMTFTLFLEDNFNYTNGAILTDNGWTAHSSAGTNAISVGTNNGLTFQDYGPVSSTNAVILQALASSEDVHKTFAQQTSGKIYAAFLVKVNSVNTTGDYFAHFGPNPIGTEFRGRVFAKRDASNKLAFGVCVSSSPTYTGFNYDLGTTYLLLLKYEFISGSGNDKVYLHVFTNGSSLNPEPGTYTINTAVSETDATGIGSFAFRQGGTSSPNATIDALRVSNKYFGTDGALPVELTSFTAKASGTTVTLNWETKTEVDNNGFEIERNANGNWSKIGFVEGHGTANSPKYYSFSDANPLGNKIQYRLKQIDNDGSFEYSPVVEVELAPVNYTLYQNYPNPFNPSTVIRYAMPVAGMVTIDVFNALGEKVSTLLNGQVEAGFNQVSFDATNLPSGLYFYRIQSGDFTSIKKMLLMK